MRKVVRPPVDIIGAPLDLGAGRRGTDMGPSAVRLAGLQKALTRAGFEDVRDRGNVNQPMAEMLEIGDPSARYLDAIADHCTELADRVRESLAAGRVPVVIGGDHSVAVGTISGVAAHHRERGEEIGVIWFDAHGDMNRPASSPSGNVHGMPLAALLGHWESRLSEIGGYSPKLSPGRVVLVGIRDLDKNEREIVHESGVKVFTMTDIDANGMAAVTAEAIRIAAGPEDGVFHVSFDLDGVDPDYAPGVGTAVPGGLTFREAHLALELIAASGKMTSIEMTEINPILDVANKTGALAMELILSGLGKRIYRA